MGILTQSISGFECYCFHSKGTGTGAPLTSPTSNIIDKSDIIKTIAGYQDLASFAGPTYISPFLSQVGVVNQFQKLLDFKALVHNFK